MEPVLYSLHGIASEIELAITLESKALDADISRQGRV